MDQSTLSKSYVPWLPSVGKKVIDFSQIQRDFITGRLKGIYCVHIDLWVDPANGCYFCKVWIRYRLL